MRTENLYNENIALDDHPLSPLFYKFIAKLKARGNTKMMDDLLRVSKFNDQKCKQLIAQIIAEMSKLNHEHNNDNLDIDFLSL